MSSCFGFRKTSHDTEPLLPRYEDDTNLQRQLHKKLHTYQMLRALSKGSMPSTEQAVINLRTLIASDFLNPNKPEISDSGRRLLRNARDFLRQFIEILRKKNGEDQLQDFIWHLTHSRVSLDTGRFSNHASNISAKADASATYESLRTVGSLLLTNADFRLFVDDIGTVVRQVLAETASAFSDQAAVAAKEIEPSEQEKKVIQGPGADEAPPPTAESIGQGAADVSKIITKGAAQTGQHSLEVTQERFSGQQKQALLYRLKQVVLGLRKRTDYTDSISILSQLLQRYAVAYSRAANTTLSSIKEDVDTNADFDKVAGNFWSLLTSFGERRQWDQLEKAFEKIMQHSKSDPDFENLMMDIGNAVQSLLTDPDFYDSVDERMQELRHRSKKYGVESGLRSDLDDFLLQMQSTINSTMEDRDIIQLATTARKIVGIVSPKGNVANPELVTDSLHIFLPLLIRGIQHVPIPRLEVSVPEMDLLLENLILEPGRSVNATSFLPYRLLITIRNDLEIRKAHSKKTTSRATSLMTISIAGLSVCANDLGFWIRAHSGPIFRFADEGIASFFLDERGIDVTLDLEIARERLEEILTLRAVKVHIHKLDYKLKRSKLSWFGWLLKPFLKHLIRRSVEKKLAESIADFLHAANRELVFARERLRATRIADPRDVTTFVKAVLARLTPKDDPDVYTRVGVDAPASGIFKGVYTPGSIVKVWHDEADRADEIVEIGEDLGTAWRNPIFDVPI